MEDKKFFENEFKKRIGEYVVNDLPDHKNEIDLLCSRGIACVESEYKLPYISSLFTWITCLITLITVLISFIDMCNSDNFKSINIILWVVLGLFILFIILGCVWFYYVKSIKKDKLKYEAIKMADDYIEKHKNYHLCSAE